MISPFYGLSALVIGDVIVDAYLLGVITRNSPEAPVPLVDISNKELRLGGAANVALNIHALGATPTLLSIVGEDDTARHLIDLLKLNGLSDEHILRHPERTTSLKTRVIQDNKHILRFDQESSEDLTLTQETWILNRLNSILSKKKVDVIILQDYNKGLLTSNCISTIIELAKRKGIPVTVDPKKNNFFAYKNVDLFKPNLIEFSEAIGYPIDALNLSELQKAARLAYQRSPYKNLMVTLGKNGIFCCDDRNSSFIAPAKEIFAIDVSGAGDTVISIATLALIKKYPIERIAQVANDAAGIVCQKIGVVPICYKELYQQLPLYMI